MSKDKNGVSDPIEIQNEYQTSINTNEVPEEYITLNETKTIQINSSVEKNEVKVDDKLYGINKPFRITIKAKISHD